MIRSFLIYFILCSIAIKAQNTDINIFGDVRCNGEHIPYANIKLKNSKQATVTDKTGHYIFTNLPQGTITLVTSIIGYQSAEKTIVVEKNKSYELNFELSEEIHAFDELVVTGTKTFKRKTESAVIVNVIDSKALNMLQANTLSEGLCFQPGLRMETDCQTCNYTQLRMNGLGGAYSQVLINGRQIFGPLTGLYGLEQIPANMIERIEVVRGGGSSLYGSSAIAGTVNVITRNPNINTYSVGISTAIINKLSADKQLNAHVTALSDNRNAGITLYGTRRGRQSYDHNNDGFSEMPLLNNNTFGLSGFVKPWNNGQLTTYFSTINEYRRGGDLINEPAHIALQSEDRTHDVLIGGLEMKHSFSKQTDIILYTSAQQTNRKHYTGIVPDSANARLQHFLNPPYGTTQNITTQNGIQTQHTINEFWLGKNTFLFGAEYQADRVVDSIKAYQYGTNQNVTNMGIFVQTDWEVQPKLSVLAGARTDKHKMLKNYEFSPRVGLLYKPFTGMQLRASYATGFRAPQAFDSDMHLAFAAGGIQTISLSPNLKAEHSKSYSLSVNFDKATHNYIYGFTVEGFYTLLENSFVLEEISKTSQGFSKLEKRNGGGAIVQGVTIEARANFNRKWQIETGVTLQNSLYNRAIEWSKNSPALRTYLRSPNSYGYYNLSYGANLPLKLTLSGVYTGSMLVPHYAGAPGTFTDVVINSPSFFESNFKISYSFNLTGLASDFEINAGVQNIFNSYQTDFDTGKNRDSNYIYGPSRPQTFFAGVKFGL